MTRSDEEILLEWEYHPLVERKRKTLILIPVLLGVWYLGFRWFDAWGLFMTVIFTIGPLSGYIFPTRYRLSDKRVDAMSFFHRTRKRWSKFVSYKPYDDAVQLFFDHSSLRGVLLKGVLLFFQENGEEVLELVSSKLPSEEERIRAEEKKEEADETADSQVE